MKPKKYIDVLEFKMIKFGDNNETLAKVLGIDRRTVARIRTGESIMTVPILKRLCEHYDLTEKEIVKMVLGDDCAFYAQSDSASSEK